MSKQIDVLKLALEALDGAEALLSQMGLTHLLVYGNVDKSITAIKEALAQPEQPKVRTGDCLLTGVCASEGHKIQPKEPEQEPAKLWCDTCEGTGKVYQEHQAGCHVGGDFECPDCDGKGYIVSRIYAITPQQPKEPEQEPNHDKK